MALDLTKHVAATNEKNNPSLDEDSKTPEPFACPDTLADHMTAAPTLWVMWSQCAAHTNAARCDRRDAKTNEAIMCERRGSHQRRAWQRRGERGRRAAGARGRARQQRRWRRRRPWLESWRATGGGWRALWNCGAREGDLGAAWRGGWWRFPAGAGPRALDRASSAAGPAALSAPPLPSSWAPLFSSRTLSSPSFILRFSSHSFPFLHSYALPAPGLQCDTFALWVLTLFILRLFSQLHQRGGFVLHKII